MAEGTVQLDNLRRTLDAIKTVRAGVATEGTSLTVDQCIALVDFFDANRRYLCGEEEVDALTAPLSDGEVRLACHIYCLHYEEASPGRRLNRGGAMRKTVEQIITDRKERLTLSVLPANDSKEK